MAAELVGPLSAMSFTSAGLDSECTDFASTASDEPVTVRFKVSGMTNFDLDLEKDAAIRDVKKLATKQCGIEPEHMRLIYRGAVLKDGASLACYQEDAEEPIQILFTAGHESLVGGSRL